MIAPATLEVIRGIGGWFSEREGARLAELAAGVPPGQEIVEVGSYLGRSSCWMAASVAAGVRVTCVDPWLGPRPGREGTDDPWDLKTGDAWLAKFTENVRACGVEDRVVPVRATSAEAAAAWDGRPVGLLFVDAVHEYDSILEDFTLWSPHIAPGGWLALHDYSHGFPDTARVVGRHILPTGEWEAAPLAETLWTARRRA